MSEVFRVEEDHGHGDVIAEHPDHVLRQRQHLGQAAVIHTICCATQGTPIKPKTILYNYPFLHFDNLQMWINFHDFKSHGTLSARDDDSVFLLALSDEWQRSSLEV